MAEKVSIEDAMSKIAFLCVMHIERQRDEIEQLKQARDQWKDNYQTLLEAKVPTPQEGA
jgi:hypothetical protein